MRVAFFGGSFDPPHLGHLAVARAARQALGLDRILLAPVGVQPLKHSAGSASWEQRMEMTRRLLDGEPGMEVSAADGPRAGGGANYTAETLERLRSGLAPGDELYLLMGADSLLTLARWHRAAEIPFLATLVVASRPGFSLSELSRAMPPGVSIAAAAEGRMPGVVGFELANAAGGRANLYLLPELSEPASATGIRSAIAHHESRGAVLVPAVADYIREHGLYAGDGGGGSDAPGAAAAAKKNPGERADG